MPFPLPLTPFEYYYWSDDRPEYPTTFPIDLRFSGNLERDSFLSALRQALDRHPLLDARIDDRSSPPRWIRSGQMPPVAWNDDMACTADQSSGYIDLKRESGLRVAVWTREMEARVLLQIHHACCDGIGALRFVEDLLIAYAMAVDGPRSKIRFRKLDIARLADRAWFGVAAASQPSLAVAMRDIWITARLWWAILFRKPALLATSKKRGYGVQGGRETSEASSVLDFAVGSVSSEQMNKLRHGARLQGAALNDLLLRDLFFAIANWNAQNGQDGRQHLRLNVPVNLRGRDDRTMPAANRLGFSFVSHDVGGSGDRGESLAAVHEQMERIKQWKLGLYFLGGLAFGARFRGLVPWALRRKRSFATMVMSNLGRTLTHTGLPRSRGRLICGNVTLERITGAPPIRPLTRGAIAVMEYAGETTINLRCDPQCFDREDTQALLDLYLARLNDSARLGS